MLVRSEAVRARLPADLKASLVLTVDESKGLEFDGGVPYRFLQEQPSLCMNLPVGTHGPQQDGVVTVCHTAAAARGVSASKRD